MTGGLSDETKMALLAKDVENLEERVKALVNVVERNNELLARSRGIVFGASIVISSVWGIGITAWNYFK